MEKAAAERNLHGNRSSEIHNQSGENKAHVEPISQWFEESLGNDLKRAFALNSGLYKGITEFQAIALLDTKHFGKVLVVNGKMKRTENDEFIYHECLIHPALIFHDNPRSVFIMGGGGGFAAREALKHHGLHKVVMCEIDTEVVDVCRKYFTTTAEVFADERFHAVINDAKVELEKSDEKYDVIVGDLADPFEGGPSNQLYTKPFYQGVIKKRLNHSGIFVTQAGPAGVVTHKAFSTVYHTIKEIFKYVVAYTVHVPSFADERGWIMASDQPLNVDSVEMESRIKERIIGELQFLDGAHILSCTVLNKTLETFLLKETLALGEENEKSLHKDGVNHPHSN